MTYVPVQFCCLGIEDCYSREILDAYESSGNISIFSLLIDSTCKTMYSHGDGSLRLHILKAALAHGPHTFSSQSRKMDKLTVLPSELLTSILAYATYEDSTWCEYSCFSKSFQPCSKTHSIECSRQQLAFTNLCLVSRKIRSHVVDIFWRDLYCLDLRTLHRILQTQPNLGGKVYQLYLGNLFFPARVKRELKEKCLEQSRAIQSMLYNVLAAAPNLCTLCLHGLFPGWTKEQWTLSLPCTNLRILDVSNLTIYPETIAHFSSLVSLQSLAIQKAAISKNAWKSEVPMLKSTLSLLRFEITKWSLSRNRCNKVTCIVLHCFPHLQRLELYLGPSTRRDYDMSRVLRELPARSNISFLKIHYAQSSNHDSTVNASLIDLSTWTNLMELCTDNITLWPIADDPESRELLYERLPGRLKILNIDFLYWEHGSRANYRPDGQRRLPDQEGRYIWDGVHFSKRFQWLLNFVLPDSYDGASTVLPQLETVHLRERSHSDPLVQVDPPSMVSSAFRQHGIDLVIEMIGPTLLPC